MAAVSQTAFAAAEKQEVENFLQRFRANPAQMMNQIPEKRDERGKVIRTSETLFPASAIRTRDYVAFKDQLRQEHCTQDGGARICLKDVLPGRAPFAEDDLVENLVDNGQTALRSIDEMHNRKLNNATLANSPWSDNYWPIYRGILAARYADPRSETDDWKDAYTFSKENALHEILANAPNQSSIDMLSPSEKYDLLVGDSDGTLTKAMWKEGEGYYSRFGKVETWMGICHGWAPAAYMLPRPSNAITVTAADGRTKIRFFPSDIKALGSLIWANSQPYTKFIGGRCNDKNPPRDQKTGRIISEKCVDTNPGTWHMAVVNQLGVSKRSMVIDATFDYEVWNQPIYSYSYAYFNPQSQQMTQSLQEARVAMGDFKNDVFKAFRKNPKATHVVGIVMNLSYVVETAPTHAVRDSRENDAITTVRYMYDVELDAKGNIIGGEWYSSAHPDFLWTPAPGARAESYGDRMIRETWNGQRPVPASFKEAARRASQAAQPLAKVVDVLFGLSAANLGSNVR
ncbi:MAG: hypothetical protein NDJ90_14545 [Oligoflexia bacterium]|nr:hypothetical protein [Oligoflexia bacterium]